MHVCMCVFVCVYVCMYICMYIVMGTVTNRNNNNNCSLLVHKVAQSNKCATYLVFPDNIGKIL